MPNTLSDEVWQIILNRIHRGNCIPFLGAGASCDSLPLGGQIARQWAEQEDYPLEDHDDLIAVSQYLAIRYDSIWPKRQILEQFIEGAIAPDFDEVGEPHGTLAKIPLPIYMTTNYDSFMIQALDRHPFREPRRSECQWNSDAKCSSSELDDKYEPSAANPLVFHLHGYSKPEHLVLTEDDYLRFLTEMSRNPELLPVQISNALQRSSVVFIGYKLADWNFRILFENFRAAFEFQSVAVLTPPGENAEQKRRSQAYLSDYYKRALGLEIYWGKAKEFCAELYERWKDFKGQRGTSGEPARSEN